MGKTSDVKINASGVLGDVTPTGVTITYAVGQIPAASVSYIPKGEDGKISPGGIINIDAMRREEASISVSVNTRAGTGETLSRKLTFSGLLDGHAVSNFVGQNSYKAVLKGKAQTLLELTTYTPGIHPAGLNPYTIASPSLKVSPQDRDSTSVRAWNSLVKDKALFKLNPIKFYTELIKLVLKAQKGSWLDYMGPGRLIDNEIPFKAIFESANYQKALGIATALFQSIDTSAVDSFPAPAGDPRIQNSIKQLFIGGPNILLENYLNFLSTLGCTLVFGNSKIFAVPINSVLKPTGKAPSFRSTQSEINAAGPVDYVAYTYNDVGYRDIANVIVTAGGYAGAPHSLGSVGGVDYNHVAHFSEKAGLSKASGVLVVKSHPWASAVKLGYTATDGKSAKQQMDSTDSMYKNQTTYDSTVIEVSKQKAARVDVKKQSLDFVKAALTNYAETKFYQARFADRTGSFTMDFNPYWAPGTGGTMYIRETGTFVAFYVTSVTHNIDVAPGQSGNASTSVDFCCGRVGSSPAGTNSDAFLGYDAGKEKAIQKAFVSDIGAS
jgi:hypothetical protein